MDIEKLDRIVVHVHPNEYSEGVIFKNRVDDLDPEMKDIFEYHNDDKIIIPFLNNTAFVIGKSTFIINDIDNHTKFTITCGRYTDSGKFVSKKETLDITKVYGGTQYYAFSMMIATAIDIVRAMAYAPEYVRSRIVSIPNKKKNKKPIKIHEYRFDYKLFIEDYVGQRYSKWDRISIGTNYSLYDPNSILAPVFPLQHGIITSGFENLTSIPDDKAAVSRNITMKLAIAFNVITKSTISIKAYALNIDGKGEIISNCIYDFKSDTFERVSNDIPIDTVKANVSEVIDKTGDNDIINLCIDVLKYMVYHVELVSKNDIITGTMEGSGNYIPKTNDKPRFETSICSHKVYGITKKVIPITEAEAKEKRKYTPCQYAVTVKGHFRHYKSGKVIWVEHYIRNKDKEFKPKDYVDKKKEG